MRVVDLIIKKKEGRSLSNEEIHFLIDGYVKEEIPDYQISSLLMAICLKGLNEQEQTALTMEMLNSGEVIDLSMIDGICVDKHSTGGVGDKTTLVVAPIVASCGLRIAKMSGRGLGHTGGTLDKLESIPNFRISLTQDEFIKQVKEISIAVVGQTANIAPADKKLYALRDVTGTVESIGLIAASIMSKKLASGASHILLDVKVGDGAFMKTLKEAKMLAQAMVKIGNNSGRKTVAILTDMEQPLGVAVGNSLEVIEAIETLKGKGPKDFQALCIELSSEILLMAGIANDKADAVMQAKTSLTSGSAISKFKEMLEYQGANTNVLVNYDLFTPAKSIITIKSEKSGYIKKIQALQIGNAAMLLGAGRNKKEDVIDMSVGIKVLAKVGDYVRAGDALAIVHANEQNVDLAISEVIDSFTIVDEEVTRNNIVLDIVY